MQSEVGWHDFSNSFGWVGSILSTYLGAERSRFDSSLFVELAHESRVSRIKVRKPIEKGGKGPIGVGRVGRKGRATLRLLSTPSSSQSQIEKSPCLSRKGEFPAAPKKFFNKLFHV